MNITKYFYSSTVFKYSSPSAHILLEYFDFLLEFFDFLPTPSDLHLRQILYQLCCIRNKCCILNTLLIGSQIKRKKEKTAITIISEKYTVLIVRKKCERRNLFFSPSFFLEIFVNYFSPHGIMKKKFIL